MAFHDRTLDRVTDARARSACGLTARSPRCGSAGSEPIPLIEDLLGAWPDLRFNIDLKDEPGIALLPGVLRRTGAWDRVCVTSFSGAGCAPPASCSTGRCAWPPRRPRSPPSGARSAPPRRAAGRACSPGGWRGAQVRCAQVPGRVATGSFVRRAHALGLDVHVWTINDRAEMIRFLDLGADGIMTDDIEMLREVLIERGQWYPGAAPDRWRAVAGPGNRDLSAEIRLGNVVLGNLVRVFSVA